MVRNMRRNIVPTTLLVVFATVFVPGILSRTQAREHRACSEASLQGGFGFLSTGNLNALPAPLAGPFVEVGRQTFDGRGNTDGTATASANGNLRHFTLQGTYVVNPDCTGSMTLLVSPLGATVPLDFVIDDNGAEFFAITTGGITGNTESRVYRKQFPRSEDQ
jgi:hypothetical protein